MYKLIIGSVRITVSDDNISHSQAIGAARQAIRAAGCENKSLSSIELVLNGEEIEAITTERTTSLANKKTLKQSMLDTIVQNINDRLLANDALVRGDCWSDPETGQEWRGCEVSEMKARLAAEIAAALKPLSGKIS